MSRLSERDIRASAGFIDSPEPLSKTWLANAGSSIAYLRTIAKASEQVVGSATVGPDAISIGSSPGTSDNNKVRTRAGKQAAAKRPPLIAERCRRTQFISEIDAPDFNKATLMACLSSRLIPSSGKGIRAEPPPEIRHKTKSSSVKF